MKIISPLTLNNNISEIKVIKKSTIIKKYKKFGIDVNKYFGSVKEIKLMQCNDTGYLFFYPPDLAGDSEFYEYFQNFNWYYMPWKWEHEITLRYIKNGMNILEVGCAHGAFLDQITKMHSLNKVIGLELNESTKSKNDRYVINNDTIQNFAKFNKAKFDIVCSFEVLEHIPDVFLYLKSKIDCLKDNGLLIISVPNNDSFLKYGENALNLPPHHMGLWDKNSLQSLEKLFPIKLVDMHFEELQDYHVEQYVSAVEYRKSPLIFSKLKKRFDKITGKYQKLLSYTRKNKDHIIGHTISVVFRKLS